jgi:CHC2 zinc finger
MVGVGKTTAVQAAVTARRAEAAEASAREPIAHPAPRRGVGPRMDLEDLRRTVTIADVLAAAGVELPRRGRRIVCPLHAGADNPSAFQFDDHRFRCFRCGAHGDVFDLVKALDGCDLRGAIERVVLMAGGTARVRRAPTEESRRRAVRRHRRAALVSWYAHRRSIALAARSRRRQEAQRATVAMDRKRDQQNPDTPAWDELERTQCALAAAELEVARLEPENYEPPDINRLVALWLAEQSELAAAPGADAIGS